MRYSRSLNLLVADIGELEAPGKFNLASVMRSKGEVGRQAAFLLVDMRGGDVKSTAAAKDNADLAELIALLCTIRMSVQQADQIKSAIAKYLDAKDLHNLERLGRCVDILKAD